MSKIKTVTARKILNSRGLPTIEATMMLDDNSSVAASSPSGITLGNYEAEQMPELGGQPANDEEKIEKIIKNITEVIAPKLINMEVRYPQEIDRLLIELDGTADKSNLGSSATLSVSMCAAKAASQNYGMELFEYLAKVLQKSPSKIPTPMFNIINGGQHASFNTDFQEFLLIPASSKTYDDCLKIGTGVYHALKEVLKNKNLSILTGEEGGFGPLLGSNAEAFELIKQAIEAYQLRIGFDVFMGLDSSAGTLSMQKKYNLKEKPVPISSEELINYYDELNIKYHLLYIEDGLSDDDWEGWELMARRLGPKMLISGDDLTATNLSRLQKALEKKVISSIVIKPNQIGTVSEAMAVAEAARQSGLKVVVAARSGETNDDFIADFAVGIQADYVKFGAPAHGERVAKYNRLLKINSLLSQK